MNLHTIRAGETLDKIVENYQLTKREIQDINKHITSWDHLIPGTRLRLPDIPKTIEEELNDVEPFIEDYYPKIDVPINKEEFKEEASITENLPTEEIPKKKKQPQQGYNPYYPYYPYSYMYNSYYQNRYKKRPKKESR